MNDIEMSNYVFKIDKKIQTLESNYQRLEKFADMIHSDCTNVARFGLVYRNRLEDVEDKLNDMEKTMDKKYADLLIKYAELRKLLLDNGYVGEASKHDFSDYLSEETEDALTKWYAKKYLETASKTSPQELSEDAMYYAPVKTEKDSHLLRRGYNHGYGNGYKDGYEAGRKLCNESTDGKTSDRPKGKWVVHSHSMIMECSCCGHEETAKDVGTIDLDKHFCSFCGAEMGETDYD